MISGVRHTGIVVSELDSSLHFYRDILGFKVIKKMEESGSYINSITGLENVRVTTVKLAASDGNLIELLFFSSPENRVETPLSINQVGLTHLALTTNDLDYAYNELKKIGVVFKSSPQLSPDKYAKVAFCYDPDKNLIELVEVVKDE